MKTILDTSRSWFLECLVKTDTLVAVLVEGIVGDEEKTGVAHVEFVSRPIEVRENSRRVRITFDAPIAWQVVDESFTAFDEHEVRDDSSSLQRISKSKYLAYVDENHGWYADIRGTQATHYRIWTENDVVDVVSCEPPDIKEM
jgi:hypothetical protein